MSTLAPQARATAPGQSVLRVQDLIIAYLGTIAAEPTVRAIIDAADAEPGSAPPAVFYVVPAGGVGIPDESARTAFITLSRIAEARFAASVILVPGGGFAAATAHAFAGSVRAVVRARLPLGVHTDVAQGLSWLRRTVAPRGTRMPDDDAALAAIERARTVANG